LRNPYRRFSLILFFVVFGSQPLDSRALAQAQTVAPGIPGQISADDAKALEEALIANPENVAARGQLISYYFYDEINASHSPESEEKREKQIFWLIEHRPELEVAGSAEAELFPEGPTGSPEGYVRGKQLWLQQVDLHPDNQQILRNAAQFLSLTDGKIARELLEKASAFDPSDMKTASALAETYEHERQDSSPPEEKLALARKVLSLRKSVLERVEGEQRFYELGDVATSAFEAGQPEDAKQYASELLKSAEKFKGNWNYGNALHHGNIVLGRVALSFGDIPAAKEYLLAAGQMPGSPQLDSFGPNMILAKELLEKGERDIVLTYLQLCGKFWKLGADDLQSWTATIKGGGIPDFGANLDY
jgi:hypothetical protein